MRGVKCGAGIYILGLLLGCAQDYGVLEALISGEAVMVAQVGSPQEVLGQGEKVLEALGLPAGGEEGRQSLLEGFQEALKTLGLQAVRLDRPWGLGYFDAAAGFEAGQWKYALYIPVADSAGAQELLGSLKALGIQGDFPYVQGYVVLSRVPAALERARGQGSGFPWEKFKEIPASGVRILVNLDRMMAQVPQGNLDRPGKTLGLNLPALSVDAEVRNLDWAGVWADGTGADLGFRGRLGFKSGDSRLKEFFQGLEASGGMREFLGNLPREIRSVYAWNTDPKKVEALMSRILSWLPEETQKSLGPGWAAAAQALKVSSGQGALVLGPNLGEFVANVLIRILPPENEETLEKVWEDGAWISWILGTSNGAELKRVMKDEIFSQKTWGAGESSLQWDRDTLTVGSQILERWRGDFSRVGFPLSFGKGWGTLIQFDRPGQLVTLWPGIPHAVPGYEAWALKPLKTLESWSGMRTWIPDASTWISTQTLDGLDGLVAEGDKTAAAPGDPLGQVTYLKVQGGLVELGMGVLLKELGQRVLKPEGRLRSQVNQFKFGGFDTILRDWLPEAQDALEAVALKYLNLISQGQFGLAAKLATPETAPWLEMMQRTMDAVEPDKNSNSGTQVHKILKIEKTEDPLVFRVFYETKTQNGTQSWTENEELNLKSVEGLWLVDLK